jgi:hypothetical protein
MKYLNRNFATASLIGLFLISTAVSGLAQEHIRKLDAVRTSMSSMGSSLPDLIRAAKPRDIRTLERVFEINNYALVTIESYLKMIRISLQSGNGINKDVIGAFNEWLRFITNYCEFDLKYMDEAISQTEDKSVVDILKSQKQNITSLRDAAQVGIAENTEIGKTL